MMNEKIYSEEEEKYDAENSKPIKEEREEEQNWRIIEVKGTYFETDRGNL